MNFRNNLQLNRKSQLILLHNDEIINTEHISFFNGFI